MTLLRRVLGETLRGQRLRQRRTLREVSGAARVSLGYLSEVERGQKEASSELLASICEALNVRLSDVLRQVSDSMRRSERVADVARAPVAPARQLVPAGAARGGGPTAAAGPIGGDGAELGVDLDLPMDFDRGELDRVGVDTGLSTGPDQDRADVEPVEVDELDPDRFDPDRFDPDELDAQRLDADRPDAERFDPAEADPARPQPDRTGLDGVDLADLETGEGLADVDALLSLTDLSCCLAEAHRPTACLAGAGAAA